MSTRKLISYDWAMKKLLRDDIRILEVLDTESNKDDARDKYNRVDLKVKNAKGEILVIEVQYEREWDYLLRIFYANLCTPVEHMREGAPYSKVVKVVSVKHLS